MTKGESCRRIIADGVDKIPKRISEVKLYSRAYEGIRNFWLLWFVWLVEVGVWLDGIADRRNCGSEVRIKLPYPQ